MTLTGRTEDFASAIMMRLVAAGLARQGIPASLPATSGAHVSRADKRAVLERVYLAHGPRVLLAIADAAPHMPPEPLVQALARASNPKDLMDRWHRLERFSHGRHTVQVELLGGASFRLTHRARDSGPAPSPAESLVVLGLLAVLVEMTQAGTVTLKAENGAIWRSGGAWSNRAGDSFDGSVQVLVAPASTVAPQVHASIRIAPHDHLRKMLAADPLRRWCLAEIASDMRMSTRTLQRRLAGQSLTLSRMIADARLHVAATHLCDPDGPELAEIGFLAGYSDQAHFTRSFTHAVGTTPSGYRADFRG